MKMKLYIFLAIIFALSLLSLSACKTVPPAADEVFYIDSNKVLHWSKLDNIEQIAQLEIIITDKNYDVRANIIINNPEMRLFDLSESINQDECQIIVTASFIDGNNEVLLNALYSPQNINSNTINNAIPAWLTTSAPILKIVLIVMAVIVIIAGCIFYAKAPKGKKRKGSIIFASIACFFILASIFLNIIYPSGSSIFAFLGNKNIDSEELQQRIIFSILAIAVTIINTIILVRDKKKLKYSVFKLSNHVIERTPEQNEKFWNSWAYKTYADDILKSRKAIIIRYGICFGIIGIGLIVSAFINAWGGAYVTLAGIIASCGIDLAVYLKGNKRDYGSLRDWKKEYCIKCGGNNKIIKTEFLKTEYDTKEIVLVGTHDKIDGEVINKEKRYNKSKERYEDIVTIKYTYHYYKVTRKCDNCGEVTTEEEILNKPPVNITTNIAVENMKVEKIDTVTIEQPKPLPFVFCQFCGGKNKGEATSCEHCGGRIFKE